MLIWYGLFDGGYNHVTNYHDCDPRVNKTIVVESRLFFHSVSIMFAILKLIVGLWGCDT